MKIVKQQVKVFTRIDEEATYKELEYIGRMAYKSHANNKEGMSDTIKFIKMIISKGHLGILEHHNVTLEITSNRAILNEMTRHRHASFVQNSTRYIKFKDEIAVVKPFSIRDKVMWKWSMIEAEKAYFYQLEQGISPQIARDSLPLALASDIIVTMNLRSWLHFLELRLAKSAHPQMRELADMIYMKLNEILPVIFNKE